METEGGWDCRFMGIVTDSVVAPVAVPADTVAQPSISPVVGSLPADSLIADSEELTEDDSAEPTESESVELTENDSMVPTENDSVRLVESESVELIENDSVVPAENDSVGLAAGDSLATPTPLPRWYTPDAVADATPAEVTRDFHTLAAYFRQKLNNPDDQVRAIYHWIANNIEYNVYTSFVSRYEEYSEEKEAMKTLAERKGTCQQYTVLFKMLCEECGVDVCLIHGYNKSGKYLLPDSHQWCAARIGSEWCMFDPTWGAGYIENYTFVPSPNDRYFKVAPDSLLKTHMPFDPLWQMSTHPLSYKEFDSGEKDTLRTSPYFAWKDTLSHYLQQTPLERMESMSARMQFYKENNPLVRNELLLIASNIRITRLQHLIDTYNLAMELQGVASDSINKFIRYRNATFEPLMPDSAIQRMVDVPGQIIQRADSVINTIHEVPDDYRERVVELRTAIINLASRIYREDLFLQQYFNTPRKNRKELFMR